MKISGTIVQVLPPQSGTGGRGEWKKQDYILETHDLVPSKICFTLWGNKIEQYQVQEGQDVVVSVRIESVPFKDRWYTSIKGWKVELQQNLLDYEKEDISLYLSNNKNKETIEVKSDGYLIKYEASEEEFLHHRAKAITVLSFLDGKGNDVLTEEFPNGIPFKLKKIIGNHFYLHIKQRVVQQNGSAPA